VPVIVATYGRRTPEGCDYVRLEWITFNTIKATLRGEITEAELTKMVHADGGRVEGWKHSAVFLPW
jgi:hypothetical protein